MVRSATVERSGPLGPICVQRVIKLLPVAAISITVRVPFAVNHVEDPGCVPRSIVQQRLAF